MLKQRTLKNSIKASGTGIHTGKKVLICLLPAPENTGVRFRRVDCSPMVEIPAKPEYVGETSFCTTLTKDNVVVSTVEHILSALAGLGIDNIYIEINGPEVPIMDGSAALFVFLIQSAGIVEQSANKGFIRILKPIEVRENDKLARLEPFEGSQINFMIDYEHPIIRRGGQNANIDLTSTSFINQIARARTYGFLSDYEWLRAKNLASGASLENAVVLDEAKVLNKEGLRYDNEFVRHKILDAIGDLYLLGHSIIGAFYGVKSGHTLHNKLNQTLLDNPDAWEIVHYEAKKAPRIHYLTPEFLMEALPAA